MVLRGKLRGRVGRRRTSSVEGHSIEGWPSTILRFGEVDAWPDSALAAGRRAAVPGGNLDPGRRAQSPAETIREGESLSRGMQVAGVSRHHGGPHRQASLGPVGLTRAARGPRNPAVTRPCSRQGREEAPVTAALATIHRPGWRATGLDLRVVARRSRATALHRTRVSRGTPRDAIRGRCRLTAGRRAASVRTAGIRLPVSGPGVIDPVGPPQTESEAVSHAQFDSTTSSLTDVRGSRGRHSCRQIATRGRALRNLKRAIVIPAIALYPMSAVAGCPIVGL